MLSNSIASELNLLPGLDSAKRLVRGLLESNSGVHAVMLYGMPGARQADLAAILAKGWLAHTPSDDDRAAGAYARGNNPDSLIVKPGGPSNIIPVATINGESNQDGSISIKEFFRSAPIMSRHKVVILHSVHRLNLSAANALLKTLEEPHAHGKLILTTESIGEVLTTVRSRCLCVVCELPTDFEENSTMAIFGIAPGRYAEYASHEATLADLARFTASLSDKRAGDALALAEQFRRLCDRFETKDKSARASQAEVLGFFATATSRHTNFPAEWTHAIIESHRRIIGNGSAPLIFDALFSQMMLA